MQVDRKFHRICRDDRLWARHRDFPYRLKNALEPKGNAVGNWIVAAIKGEKKEPPARLCHTAIVYGDSMYIQGGHITVQDSQMFGAIKSDFWKFNLVTKRWDEIQEPRFPTRTEHSSVLWNKKMWMYGGFAGNNFVSDVMCYDFETKSLTTIEAKGQIPAPRSAHTAIAYGGKMWVFAGWNGNEQNNDLYTFDFETYEWEKVVVAGSKPLPRCSHCAALCPGAKSFFVFGGCGGRLQNYFDDLWQFSFETMSWTCVGRLKASSRMKMVEYRNNLYIYGGWNSKEHFSTFYEFNLATRTWRNLNTGLAPDQGRMGQFSMCIFNHKLYQFGGYNDTVKMATSDLHVYRMGKPEFTEGAVSAR
jgi:hypothetical protein